MSGSNTTVTSFAHQGGSSCGTDTSHCGEYKKDHCNYGYQSCDYGYDKHDKGGKTDFATLLIWFIIIAVVTWLILFSLNPTWVQERDAQGNPTGNVDYSRLLLFTIIIAAVITVIVWLLMSYA